MSPMAIAFGVMLMGLGLVGYLGAVVGVLGGGKASPTALIPCVAGIMLIVLGLVARRPAARKHAMHGAAMIGLLGFAAPAIRLIGTAIRQGLVFSTAVVSQVIMAVLCAVFVALCVRSFVQARRQREMP